MADKDGNILYRPKRYVVFRGQPFRGHQEVYNKAQRLKGQLVTTKTANPAKNSPEQWWIDINPHYASLTSVAVSASKEPTYTDEQEQCIASFHGSGHLKISAFAGAGKTTTLLGIANSAKNKRGLYLAFNREIKDEASRKFPSNIECRTTHSIAYEFCAKHYSKEKISGGTNAIRVAERLKLEPVSFGEHKNYSANAIIRRFNESRQIIGNTKVSSSVNRSQAKAYIYRTNIGLLDGLANQISLNKIPFISGGTGDLTALIHDVELMQSGQPAISESDFFGFKNWFDLVNYSCTNEGSSHRTKVQIIEKYNIQNLTFMTK